MTGNNEIKINEATMIEAVQLWLNDQFKSPPKVTSVEQVQAGSYSKEFTIKVSAPTECEEA